MDRRARARAHAVASAASATITPPGPPLAGQPPHPPSPGDLVSVITVLIFVREAGEGIPIAQWRPACLLFFFFFFSRRDPIQILPDNDLKQPRRPKQNKPTAKALLLPLELTRRHVFTPTLSASAAHGRGGVCDISRPLRTALIPPKQTGLGPDGLFKRLSLWTSAVFSFFNPSLSLGEPCDPGTPSRFVSAIR